MKVCVIGAGPSGLTTIKQLRDEGHEVVCFDKGADIGGIWHRVDGDEHEMKAYDGVVLSISLKLMAFSDFMPAGERAFTNRQGYLSYLHAYEKTYGLRNHISFHSAVTDIRKTGQSWRVTVASNGAQTEHVFDAVAVCTGTFRSPNRRVHGIENFSGEVIHSSQYRDNRSFAGKRVLVIGLAESGADIVREISEVSSRCALSIRSHTFLLPRLFGGKFSTDEMSFRAHHYEIWVRSTKIPFRSQAIFGESRLSRWAFLALTRVYGALEMVLHAASTLPRTLSGQQDEDAALTRTNNLGQSIYPLKIDLDTENSQDILDAINEWNRKSHEHTSTWSPKAIFCKNVSFIPNIVNGKIEVNDSGIERIDGQAVHFKDGSSGEFDAIVLCTGFIHDFSISKDIAIEDNNVRNLYKHCIDPAHDGRLAFIGFVRPFSGGIPTCAEMQARYFALLCSGKLRLPADVAQRIEEDKAWEEAWTALSPRHVEAIPSQILFLDSIAKEIGCLTPLSELVFKPRLLARLWFCSFNQACYRLRGPHSIYDSALEQIMSENLPGRSGLPILYFSVLSMLPYFVHPRHFVLQQAEPGFKLY